MADYILLVDDDAAVGTTLKMLLESLGHKVRYATSVNEAVSIASQVRPQLLVTDMIMPEDGGMACIERIKALHPGLPIIAISGGSRVLRSDFSLSTAKMVGANCVLSKPVARATLKHALDTLL
ncbi:response regulator [Vreelandella aquamarina]|uniref:response regulator n=1 Tax=Vreelandella aquamarina TaxID=77097 RepID=UPI00384AFE87